MMNGPFYRKLENKNVFQKIVSKNSFSKKILSIYSLDVWNSSPNTYQFQ